MRPNRVALLAGSAVLMVALFLWRPWEGGRKPGTPVFEAGTVAQGVVFADLNGNGVRDDGEEGIAGVRVSDQRTVTETDREGRWALPAREEAVYFVVKPRGYMTSVSTDNIPRFYYVHRATDPLDLEGPVVPRTGPLPASLDFPLVRTDEPDRFQAIVMGDPQTRTLEEVGYFTRDVLEEMVGSPAAFAITLGDITFDDPGLYPAINQATGAVGIPFYNTHGNHDANYDGADNRQHFETWRSVFGPRYYSFDYGPVHFVILSDVVFPEAGSRYVAGLGDEQLHWLEEDLSYVPLDRLVVLAMHIPPRPAADNPDFARLYEILRDRPYTLSFSAHSHVLQQGFLTAEQGWLGPEPHYHINAGAACGRWWEGGRDETDIPHATSSDGTPNGYFVVTFDHNRYSTRFKAARRPAEYQMQVILPDEIEVDSLSATPVLVNYFNGNRDDVVEMTVGESGDWIPLEFSPQVDPLYARVTKRESGQESSVAFHVWEGSLPADLAPGGHRIRVRATDRYGQEWTAARILRVTGN